MMSQGYMFEKVIWKEGMKDTGIHERVVCASVAEPQTDWTDKAQSLTCMFSPGPDYKDLHTTEGKDNFKWVSSMIKKCPAAYRQIYVCFLLKSHFPSGIQT